MKYFWIPAAILTLLLALSLWNARAVAEEIDGWCATVDAARAAAQDGNLAAAEASMAALEQSWQARRTYYHSILEHDELDGAEEFYARACSALRSGDDGGFLAETAALAAQLRVIAEMQSLRIENIL